MYTHILIDLDDTLWDFRKNSKIAMQEIFNDYELIDYYDSFESFYCIYMEKNHQLWEQYAKGEISKDFLSLERFLYPLRIVGNEDVELAKKMGDDFLYRTAMQTNLVDGAIEILEYLRSKGYILSIISNGFVDSLFFSFIDFLFDNQIVSILFLRHSPFHRFLEFAQNHHTYSIVNIL